MTRARHSIETTSGGMFNFDAPDAADVNIVDLATSLGNVCRFGGHVRFYYSVAEHACLVYRLVRDAGFPPDVCYAALHHDSHEAYLGDCPTPLKDKIKVMAPGMWELLEADIDRAIFMALGVSRAARAHDAIRCADTQALFYEAAVLKRSGAAKRDGSLGHVEQQDVPDWAVAGWTAEFSGLRFARAHYEAYEATCSLASA